MKSLFVFGTRPEAVKMAPLILAMHENPRFAPYVCVTGQHRSMLDQFLRLFAITPDQDLDVMQPGQGMLSVLQKSLGGLQQLMQTVNPDVVLVQGDTVSTLAGALAGYYAQVPVAHVEAGLRTYDLTQPWPEEGNRQMVSRLAHFHFAPTESSAQNLRQERLTDRSIHVTGNTVVDALLWMRERNASRSDWEGRFGTLGDPADVRGPVVLVTGHRRESFGRGFEEICRALATLAKRHPDSTFVYPVHLNPQVKEPVTKHLGDISNIHLLEPLEYDAFVYLMEHATLILTDSGGIQEEAPSLGKPVLVLRETTERPEAIEAGTVQLVGTNHERIVAAVDLLLSDQQKYQAMAQAHNPYGDGQAASRILKVLLDENSSR